jgi:hypothetical protein
MSTLITAATVKSALRDARVADQQYDVSDSKIAGLQLRVRKETANKPLAGSARGTNWLHFWSAPNTPPSGSQELPLHR